MSTIQISWVNWTKSRTVTISSRTSHTRTPIIGTEFRYWKWKEKSKYLFSRMSILYYPRTRIYSLFASWNRRNRMRSAISRTVIRRSSITILWILSTNSGVSDDLDAHHYQIRSYSCPILYCWHWRCRVPINIAHFSVDRIVRFLFSKQVQVSNESLHETRFNSFFESDEFASFQRLSNKRSGRLRIQQKSIGKNPHIRLVNACKRLPSENHMPFFQ